MSDQGGQAAPLSGPAQGTLDLACPYPGLRPFASDEAHLFFGRARQVGEMLARLETRRLLAVVGVSGCGKSSLVRAGLIPAVRDGWLASQATEWRIALMRPGSDPFAALAGALLKPEALGPERAGPSNAAAFLESVLRRGRLGLREAVSESALPNETGLLLVVDQFEEIFRFRAEGKGAGRARDEADAFVDLLLASTRAPEAAGLAPLPDASGSAGPPILVVTTMRSDFLGDCAVFAGLPEAINDAQFLTPRLSREQYEEAIREPARLHGAKLEPDLVARLLNDMGEDPDRLPVLQHALMRMWTRAAARPDWDRRLRLADYPEGGLNAALDDHCNEVYERGLADDEERRLAQVLFRALCERTGTRRDTRRPQRIADVAAVAGVPPEALYPVIEAFRRPDRSFLSPPVPEPLRPRTVVDIGHESLIAQWGLLGTWIEAESESAAEYQRLADAARFHAAGQGELLSGPSLTRVLAWREREQPTEAWARRYPYSGRFRQALAFLERSRQEAEAEQARRERERQERETERERELASARELAAARERELAAAQALAEQKARSTRNLRLWLVVSALLVATALGTAWWAIDRAQAAREAQTEAIREKDAARQAEQVARDNEAKAEAQRKSALESRAKWFSEIAGHERLAQPQLALLLALEANRAAPQLPITETIIREVLAGIAGTPLVGHEGGVTAVAVSPDGRTLASGSDDTTIRLWDLSDPKAEPRVLRGHGGGFTSVAFAPDGRTLASGSDDTTVRLWDLTDPKAEPRVLRGHEEGVTSVAFAADGRTLASGSDDRTIRLWDLTDPKAEPRTLRGHERGVTSVAFAPDGRTLASGSLDQTIRLWDLTDPKAEPRTLRGHERGVTSVAFAPDGRTLASGSDDQTVRLWDLSDPKAEPRILSGHEEGVVSVAFAADGRTLASGSRDQTVRLWDLTDPKAEPRVLRGHEHEVTFLAFAADGRTLASGSRDRTVRLWDLTDPKAEPRVLRGHENGVVSVAFAADGRTLASGSDDTTVRLWDLTDPKAEPRVLRGHEEGVTSVAFAADGRTLASGSDDTTIRLWDLSDPKAEPRVLRGHGGGFTSVAFAPDGRTLASGSDDTTVRLWDLTDPKAEPRVLRGHEEGVTSVAFAADGRTLASGSDDRTIRLWDLTDPKAEPRTLRGHERGVTSVAFAPDGRTLASGSLDQTIRLWDLTDPKAEPRVLRGHEEGVVSVAFAADGRTLASGSDDTTVRLWDLTDPKAEPRVLRGHEEGVVSVAFAADGRTLASGSDDTTVRLWDTDLPRVRAKACDRLARNLSAKEWRRYFGDEDPKKTYPTRPIHTSFFEHADELASNGEVDKAIEESRRVLTLFGGQQADPVAWARRITAPTKLRDALREASNGRIAEALAGYSEATQIDPRHADDTYDNNALCWYGSLWGQAAAVLKHCERAVALASSDPADFRDSRGVARAQVGDLTGAAEDFRAFVAWAEGSGDEDMKALIPKRRQWIESIELGRNPFDAATLEALRKDELRSTSNVQ